MTTARTSLACAVLAILALAPPPEAAAQCNWPANAPSFGRTILSAYAGEFEALVAAETLALDGVPGNDLRAIAKLFRKTELLVRKAQVLQIAGLFEQADKRFQSALGITDKLAVLLAEAAQAGLLNGEPGNRLGDRHAALVAEVALLDGDLGAQTCYGQCAEVCGDGGACYGLAYRCQCMWNACYPTCTILQ